MSVYFRDICSMSVLGRYCYMSVFCGDICSMSMLLYRFR